MLRSPSLLRANDTAACSEACAFLRAKHIACHGVDTPEMAAHIGLRDWLIGTSYLGEPPELDEDTETLGEA